MLALSLLMLAMVLIGVIKSKSNPLHQQKWFLRMALCMSPSGLIAIIAGWIVAEVSRQPWVVYGIIKTSQTISAHSAEQIITSMITFSLLYLFLSIAAIIFVGKVILNGKIQTKYRIGSN